MATPQINILVKDHNKFLTFINLDAHLKQQIFDLLRQPNASLSSIQDVKTTIEKQIKELTQQEVESVVFVFLLLLQIKADFKITNSEAVSVSLDSLERAKNPALANLRAYTQDFLQLVENNSAILVAKRNQIVSVMVDNPTNFAKSEIYPSIKPVFDENNQFLGSSIVYNLKLTTSGTEEKVIFLALDDNDLEVLENTLRQAKQQAKLIKKHFENAAIIQP